MKEKIIGIVKIFDFRLSMDLHVLRCPEHDFLIFKIYLSVWCETQILWPYERKNRWRELHEV